MMKVKINNFNFNFNTGHKSRTQVTAGALQWEGGSQPAVRGGGGMEGDLDRPVMYTRLLENS